MERTSERNTALTTCRSPQDHMATQSHPAQWDRDLRTILRGDTELRPPKEHRRGHDITYLGMTKRKSKGTER